MNALYYQPRKQWRCAAAFVAAGVIHVGAVAFASAHRTEPKTVSGPSNEPPEIFVEPLDPNPDPEPADSDPLRAPPALDEFYAEDSASPPPVRRQPAKAAPLVRDPANTAPMSVNLSSATVFALNAPRPEYPYEARRRKITGEGVALISVDARSGSVTAVAMVRSTGNAFLDNAAIAGFRRWRFKPGPVSSVTCPVTFTLTGTAF
jgi:TonB family protein